MTQQHLFSRCLIKLNRKNLSFTVKTWLLQLNENMEIASRKRRNGIASYEEEIPDDYTISLVKTVNEKQHLFPKL